MNCRCLECQRDRAIQERERTHIYLRFDGTCGPYIGSLLEAEEDSIDAYREEQARRRLREAQIRRALPTLTGGGR